MPSRLHQDVFSQRPLPTLRKPDGDEVNRINASIGECLVQFDAQLLAAEMELELQRLAQDGPAVVDHRGLQASGSEVNEGLPNDVAQPSHAGHPVAGGVGFFISSEGVNNEKFENSEIADHAGGIARRL